MTAHRCGAPGRRRHRHGGRSMVLRVFLLLVAGLSLAAALTAGLGWWLARASGAWAPAVPRDWAQQVAVFVQSIERMPDSQRALVRTLGEAAGLRPIAPADVTGTVVASLSVALSEALQRPAQVSEASGARACPGLSRWASAWGLGTEHGPGAPHCRQVLTTLADGSPIALRVSPVLGWTAARAEGGERPGTWLLPLVLLAALLMLAAAITRLALAPLLTLSRAAERFADDVDAPPLREQGPREIRTAIAAFNRMQARIRAHLSERTSMLAAITHDLQTPLTRLRLRLEQVDDARLRERLAHDLDECHQRVREGLDLARSLDDRTPLANVDLDALLRSACDAAADAGTAVRYTGDSRLTVRARPVALLRCVENLIANAVHYGESATVGATVEGEFAVITVRDRGPGIAPADLERVFEPFVRLETSRSRDSGGTGLGLTIVRNLITRQQGRVELRNPEGGRGLEARLLIPLAVSG